MNLGITIPQLGIKNNEDKFLENIQLEPDITIYNDPSVLETGEDQQLIKAIETLMYEIE